jgi:integrase
MTELTDRSEAATPGAASIHERLRSLSQRPTSLTVRKVIDDYMTQYAGRDVTRGQRLRAWQSMIGDFTLEQCDCDLMHAGRAELATKPALVYKGKDHRGLKVFDLKSRRKPKDPATLNRYMQAIGAVFSWAIEQRLAPKGWVHPCRGIKRLTEAAGRVRYLEADERARLFEAVRASKYPRLYALTLMAMKTGARRGELLALTWRDIDLDAGIAMLAKTKNGDRRSLVLLPDVVEALRPFVSTDLTRYVFGSMLSKCQTPTSIDSAWRDAVVRAGVKDFKFHDLRHCCASYMAQAGIPLNVIAEVLGHRKLDMTRRYSHLTTQTKAGAMLAALGEIK